MSRISNISRDPLMHFFAVALCLFLINDWFGDSSQEGADSKTIEISEQSLLTYFQYQNKSFNTAQSQLKFKQLSQNQKNNLLSELVREEVLYREALSLGLDSNDQIIRRRLIQKIEYINHGFNFNQAAITEEELNTYFSNHQEDYRVDSSVSFTHVFIDGKKHSKDELKAISEKQLNELQTNNVVFERSGEYGDRFHFHQNYIERTPELIASHFGKPFSDVLFSDGSKIQEWAGPIQSIYGYHLVKIKTRSESRLANLEEVSPQVLADIRRERSNMQTRQATKALINKYSIVNHSDAKLATGPINTSFEPLELSVSE